MKTLGSNIYKKCTCCREYDDKQRRTREERLAFQLEEAAVTGTEVDDSRCAECQCDWPEPGSTICDICSGDYILYQNELSQNEQAGEASNPSSLTSPKYPLGCHG